MRRARLLYLLIAALVVLCASTERATLFAFQTTYRNPIAALSVGTERAQEDYGFGDPFVLRYNGTYYLYPSTRDDQIGVHCWSSRDLVNWKYEGVCCDDATSRGAYAPEVYRANDAFYLTTSPAGKGHYIYRSESPTGPFERVTENFGLSIDGSVFIDDDGAGYFYSASDKGILAYRMTSPSSVEPQPIKTRAFMNGWTEGPTVFKHDGVYYATYCGNHVFSRGYRIDAATGISPTSFHVGSSNPVLISTEGEPFGLGHNSIVKGPNLDLYYLVYHNLVGRGRIRGWPVREANIDRLVLNRDVLSVVGPTRAPQAIPQPDIAFWFDSNDDSLASRLQFLGRDPQFQNGFLRLGGTSLVSTNSTLEGDFTAEFNLAFESESGRAGAIFCYVDENRYGRFEIDPSSNRIVIKFNNDAEEKTKIVEIPLIFRERLSFKSLRSIQIERTRDVFRFYLDDRFLTEMSADAPSGAIGYFTDDSRAIFGFMGGTNGSEGRTASALNEPIPGRASFSYRTTEKGRRAEETQTSTERRLALPLDSGDSVAFKVENFGGEEQCVALYYSARERCVAQLVVNDETTAAFELKPSTDSETARFVAAVGRATIPKGISNVRIICKEGALLCDGIECETREEVGASFETSSLVEKTFYTDGEWETTSNAVTAVGKREGKTLFGSRGWSDYSVEAEISFLDDSRNAGLLLRATEPSLGGPNNSPKLGANFVKAYCVDFNNNEISLVKREYNSNLLAKRALKIENGEIVKLRVEVKGSVIAVFVNGENYITYDDTSPLISGRVGVRSLGAAIRVERLKLSPLNDDE